MREEKSGEISPVSQDGATDADRRAALLIALAGFGAMAMGDGLTKSTGGYWPGTAVAALRFSFGAIGLACLLWLRHGAAGFAMPQPAIQLGRGAAIAFSSVCFFVAVQLMPLATAVSIGFVTPMLTALLSALVLKERAPPLVWAVSALAFAGVLLVLKPSFGGLGLRALLPLLGALGMAVLMVLNRAGAGIASPLLMQALVAMVAAPILIVTAALLHLTGLPEFAVGMPPLRVIAAAAGVAMIATIGHWLIYLATLRASAALIAPAVYVQLLSAIGVGWFVFGEIPDAQGFAGIALIVLAGLLLFRATALRR